MGVNLACRQPQPASTIRHHDRLASLLIALIPGYAQIGGWASVLQSQGLAHGSASATWYAHASEIAPVQVLWSASRPACSPEYRRANQRQAARVSARWRRSGRARGARGWIRRRCTPSGRPPDRSPIRSTPRICCDRMERAFCGKSRVPPHALRPEPARPWALSVRSASGLHN